MFWGRKSEILILASLGLAIFLSGCGPLGQRTQQFPAIPGLGPTQGPTPTPISPKKPGDPSTSGRPSTAANIPVCPANPAAAGTDVSDYDPGTLWPQVKSGGSSFAFIKATEGVTLKNSLFSNDWTNAKAAGLIRGAYHFFHPGDSPSQQAQFFLDTIGALDIGDLAPVLDWEVTDGKTSAIQIQNALLWLDLVENATGKTPIIYVDPAFWNALGNPMAFARYPLFIANYKVACPLVPPPWSTWHFWQVNVGTVVGVKSAQADQDLFNGSISFLYDLLANGF